MGENSSYSHLYAAKKENFENLTKSKCLKLLLADPFHTLTPWGRRLCSFLTSFIFKTPDVWSLVPLLISPSSGRSKTLQWPVKHPRIKVTKHNFASTENYRKSAIPYCQSMLNIDMISIVTKLP